MSRTYWNGEPTICERVRVRVGEPMAPTWWCAALAGTERQAVRVRYGRATFLLGDEDGSGWRKVTEGHGGPRWPSRSLPDSSAVIAATPTEEDTDA